MVKISKPITKARSESFEGKIIKQNSKKQINNKTKVNKKIEETPLPPVATDRTNIPLPETIVTEKVEETVIKDNEKNEKNEKEENTDKNNNSEEKSEIPPPPSIENDDNNSDELPPVLSPIESPKELEEPIYPNAIYFPTISSKVMNVLVKYMTDVEQKVSLTNSNYITEEEINSHFLWDLVVVYIYIYIIEC